MAEPIKLVVKPGKQDALEAVSLDDFPSAGGCKEGQPSSKACTDYTQKLTKWHNAKLAKMDGYVTGNRNGEHVTISIWNADGYGECKQTDTLGWTLDKFYPWAIANSIGTLEACKGKLLDRETQAEDKEQAEAEDIDDAELAAQMNAATELEEVLDLTPQTLGNKFYKEMVDIFGRDKAGKAALNGPYETAVKNLKEYAAVKEAEYKKQYGEFKWKTIDKETTIKIGGADVKIAGINPTTAPEDDTKKKLEEALKAAKEQVTATLKENYEATKVAEPASLAAMVNLAKNGQELVELSAKLEKGARKEASKGGKLFPEERAQEIKDLPDGVDDWITKVQTKVVGRWQLRNQRFICEYSSDIDAVTAVQTDEADFTAKYNSLIGKIATARTVKKQEKVDTVQNANLADLRKGVGQGEPQPRPDWDKKRTPTENTKAFVTWVAVGAQKKGQSDDEFLKDMDYAGEDAVMGELMRIGAMEPEDAEKKYEELTEKAVEEYGTPQKVSHEGSLSFKGGLIGGDKKVGEEEETEYAGTILVGEKVIFQVTENFNVRAEINAFAAGSTYLPMAEHNDYYGSTKPMNLFALGSLVVAPEYKNEDAGLSLGVEGPFVDDDIVNSTSIGSYGTGSNPLSGAFVFPLYYPSMGEGLRAYFSWNFVDTKDSKKENDKEDNKFKANVFGSFGYYFDNITLNLPTFTHSDDAENVFNGMLGVEVSGDVGGLVRRKAGRFNALDGIAYLQYGRGDESVPDPFDPSGKTTYRESSMLNGGLGVAFRQRSRKGPDGFSTSAMAEAMLAGEKPASTSDEQSFAYRLKWEASWNFLLASGVTWTPQLTLGRSSVGSSIALLDCPGCSVSGELPDSTNITIHDALFSLAVANVKLSEVITGSAKVGGGLIKEYRDEQSALGGLGLTTLGIKWK